MIIKKEEKIDFLLHFHFYLEWIESFLTISFHILKTTLLTNNLSSSSKIPWIRKILYFFKSGFKKHMYLYLHCLLERYILVGFLSYNLSETVFHLLLPYISIISASISCSISVHGATFRLAGTRLIILVLQFSPVLPGIS